MRALGVGLARYATEPAAEASGALDALFPLLRLGDDPLLERLHAAIGGPTEAAAVIVDPTALAAAAGDAPEARLLASLGAGPSTGSLTSARAAQGSGLGSAGGAEAGSGLGSAGGAEAGSGLGSAGGAEAGSGLGSAGAEVGRGLGRAGGAEAGNRLGSAAAGNRLGSAAAGGGLGGAGGGYVGDRVVRPVAVYLPDMGAAPTSVADVFLRLHLLSSRLVRPHGLSLEGVFGLLPTMVWTAQGPYSLEEFELLRLQALAAGSLPEIRAVDKFPRMVDYVIPGGVRIGDPARVRLGAHLGDGTTVMHEGFVNYNAGTLGRAMVEGRISAGVIVGDGSDVGGGASIMGTLSGGGKEVISIGRECLLGANAGLGISLGDRCTVEAGLYVTAGTKVRLPDGSATKALALSGRDDLLFRRNSQDGAVEVLHKRNEVLLNPALHASKG